MLIKSDKKTSKTKCATGMVQRIAYFHVMKSD